jgi:hypothetical protein
VKFGTASADQANSVHPDLPTKASEWNDETMIRTPPGGFRRNKACSGYQSPGNGARQRGQRRNVRGLHKVHRCHAP